MEIGKCPNCGHDLVIKYTPTPQYYDILSNGIFNLLDENDMSSVEVVCPYDEGSEEHRPDPEWEKEIIRKFHSQVLTK